MRVDIIGGGPAGLFLAALLRRDGIAEDVRVFERSGSDRTYGWGVVFPEGALNELERVDPVTFTAVTEAGTTWTPVEIRHRSSRRIVNGNRFHGIPRTSLLSILRETATRLGVRLHFDHPVTGLAGHADADLIVGADGVNSVVRAEHAEAFQPHIEHSEFRYAWLGVDRAFPYFTYIFRETEWGLFQGYCYPSGQPWSSLIVYVSEDTFQKSGLSRMDEKESVRLCEQIFAEDMEGRTIRSNGSRWSNFPHLRCGTWHHRNVVLIGDAAHTAHWSIGSGTRLAIEDAIALARELGARPPTLSDALARFETSRRGTVEKFQRAARLSERYFENVHRYFKFEPIQFSYQLVARSWRITHDDIARRDPLFTAGYDAWFHTRATGEPADIAPTPAFAPSRAGSLELPNRVVSTNGLRGAGLVITRPFEPSEADPAEPGGPPRSLPPVTHASPACVRFPQLEGPGAYAEVAGQAVRGGYAMVMLDLSAHRVTELRERPPLTALSELRAAWPAGRPVAVAVDVERPDHTLAEAGELVALAGALTAGGADVLLVEARGPAHGPPPANRAVSLVQLADAVRNEAGMTVIVDGAAQTVNEIDTIVAAGWADFCVLRPLTGEPGGES
ncbi:MAG: Anthraniloyl-CoA monooxygenase [Sphaerisporangium sp.]|jgi:anthraniloyl-CoA monooxygenase|nr:Anthraniloyl-CoA monooxygenase [Sphaerisporangium sp.]